jgi:hypothetical protein
MGGARRGTQLLLHQRLYQPVTNVSINGVDGAKRVLFRDQGSHRGEPQQPHHTAQTTSPLSVLRQGSILGTNGPLLPVAGRGAVRFPATALPPGAAAATATAFGANSSGLRQPYHSDTHSDASAHHNAHSPTHHSHHHHAAAAAAAAAAASDHGAMGSSHTHHAAGGGDHAHGVGADGLDPDKPHGHKTATPASTDGPRREQRSGGGAGGPGGGAAGAWRYAAAALAGALLGWLMHLRDESSSGGGESSGDAPEQLRSRVIGSGEAEELEGVEAVVEEAEELVSGAVTDLAHTFMSAVSQTTLLILWIVRGRGVGLTVQLMDRMSVACGCMGRSVL